MKKTIITLSLTSILVGFGFTACNSSATKVENAENKVEESRTDMIEANIDLNQVRQDSIDEYQRFKKEASDKIIAHNQSIIDFRARVASDKRKNRAEYEAKLFKLEQKNTDLKKKLDDYKDGGKDKWVKFKNEFNHDMEELGASLKDFSTKSKK